MRNNPFGRRPSETDGFEAREGSFLWRFFGVAMLMAVVLIAGGGLTASSADEGEGEGEGEGEDADRQEKVGKDEGRERRRLVSLSSGRGTIGRGRKQQTKL